MHKYKLLVPSDFSNYALNALNYAASLAKDIDAEIILLHTYIVNDSAFLGKKVVEGINKKRIDEGKKNLESLVSALIEKEPGLKITTFLKSGPVVDVINSLIQAEKIDFTVMGTLGASGLKATIVGSYATDLIKHSNRPVLTIPPNATYKGIKNIICASNLHISELAALKSVMELARLLQSNVSLYNIEEEQSVQEEKLLTFKKQVKDRLDLDKLNFILDQSEDITESVEKFICEKQPDLVVTLGRQRGFFYRLMHKNIWKILCLQNLAPFMVFPDTGKSSQQQEDDEKKHTFII